MRLRSRLDRLEKQAGLRDGRCPGCGWRPDDLRTIVVTDSRPLPDGSCPPLVEVVEDLPAQPGRPRCHLCGGYMPPLAFLEMWSEVEGGRDAADGTAAGGD